ncbi:MAG TPA: STAS domain-containing protein [Anaerolineales bacterium]|nr:STAS domain-containing protein [Anaerolineales bacterium]HNN12930.1 STAS domain-containing protein [Anaerolineales bacterium]HNO30318.1 STAS domain-containing protein [Anaerolineales bacterium]
MDVALKITKEQVQGKVAITVFHLRGWLDAQSEEQLLAEARAEYDAGARFLLINLDEVNMLTSAGIRAIQKVYKLFTPEQERYKIARVKLCMAPPQVYHVLGVTGFLQSVQNYETMQAAVDSFEE